MKIFKNFIGLAALALCLGFASCSSDDDAPSYSNVAVSNSELMTILKAKGYQFDENGKMLLDDKANSTTSLDLSGTKVDTAALKELSVFPNLKELNLSNNGYGPVFHIASLPSQITGLDLQGNDIYDFDGLVTAKVENDEVKATIIHEFTKLYLPASCKYNVEDLMPFYTQNETENKTVDMQMVNDKGSLEKYNTLREIPDEYFRAYLKTKFASLFADDTHIDISKPMDLVSKGEAIYIGFDSSFADADKVKSYAGVEYFINNPYYDPFAVTVNNLSDNCSISYIAPRKNIVALGLCNISTLPQIDLSQATNLVNISLERNSNIESLDLTNTLIANQKIKDFDVRWGNGLNCLSCSNLKEIKLPKSEIGITGIIFLYDLPSLKEMDLSGIKAISELNLLKLADTSIIYPNLQYVLKSDNTLEDISNSSETINLAISEDVFNTESAKAFITKYRDNLHDDYRAYKSYGAYRWSKIL